MTDPVVAEVYDLQLSSSVGPLVTSLRERTKCSSPTPRGRPLARLGGEGGRPGRPERAGRSAVTGSRPTRTIGVLGLYSPEPDAFGADDEAIAHILARHAAVAVASARHDETMTTAVDARKLVGQAMGILMERFDVDGDRAFAILQRYSQDNNTKLRDVAQQLIDTRKLPH